MIFYVWKGSLDSEDLMYHKGKKGSVNMNRVKKSNTSDIGYLIGILAVL